MEESECQGDFCCSLIEPLTCFDLQIFGRAGSVGAYVKRGEESGHVKITLRGDSREEQICITRKIDTSNKSEWSLNGKLMI